MLPVIAIIGRPNVGKSTLFNRLTRTQSALMSADPGTTRDRQYGEVHLHDRRFIIIDTGGVTEEKNEINQLTAEQAWQAVEEADQLLFVIDGKIGITPEDRLITDRLRRLKKPLVLLVNKTEGLDPDISIAEAYELGIGKPLAISAAHGTGTTALIETLFPKPMEEADFSAEEEKNIKLAIVGRPNVGKSTLTNRLLGEERVIVHDTPGTTRDSIYIPLKRLDQQYTLIDTAGVRKRTKTTEGPEKFSIVKTLKAIEEAHVVLYLIDARLGVSEQDLKLLGFILECGSALVIAMNKWDGLKEEVKNQAKIGIDRHLDFVSFARIHYISALHGTNVGNLFDSIDEAYLSATKKIATPLINQLLQRALLTHSPPLVSGRRVKLRYAHLGGHNPPRIIIHGNQLKALPLSYRRFLSHFFQTKLELYGTPVRIEFKTSDNPFTSKKTKKTRS